MGLATSMIIGGLVGGGAVALIPLLTPQRACPSCSEKLPRYRKPTSAKEAFWGGWTCPSCGLAVDRKGKPRT